MPNGFLLERLAVARMRADRLASAARQPASGRRIQAQRRCSPVYREAFFEGVGGELLLSPQSVEIIKFGDPGSGR